MKKVFLFFLFIISSWFATDGLHADATVTGRVTDVTTGLPIQGATVELIRGGSVRYSDTTGPQGFYSIAGIQPSNYTLVVTANGYQQEIRGIKPANNQITVENVQLTPNGGTITGTVTDSVSTLPISGATVQVLDGTTVIQTVTTNGSGVYSADNLAPGQYTVNASATGYQTESRGASVTAGGTTTENFALDPLPGEIAGTVTDSVTTNPIDGALVEVYSGPTLVGFANTDVNGDYSIPSLAPGSYTVTASATGYQSETVGASVTSSTTTTVDFALDPSPGIISGIVTDADTTLPISGASVTVYSGTNIVGSAFTDSNGFYEVADLNPGGYVVNASASGYQAQGKGAIVLAGNTSTVDFALVPIPGEISGTVTDAVTTNPIPGATIQVFRGVIPIASALTDSSGNYTIGNLAPDSYTVLASASGYQSDSKGAIVSSGVTTTVDFALQPDPGTIAGTVTDAVTTNPILGATVRVYSGQTLEGTATTDVNGDYSITGLAPGVYTVEASATDYQSASQGASVVSNVTTTVDFALDPDPGAIEGTITDAVSLAPIAGATVTVLQGVTVVGSALTDANGDYSISGLAPGSYLVVATATNYQTGFSGGIVTSNTITQVDIALSPLPGSLSGTVINSFNSDPIPGAVIAVYSGSTLVASTLTDSNGDYSISGLAPGNYNVTASATDFQAETKGAIITASTNTVLDFALDPDPGEIAGTVTDAVTTNPISGATVSFYSGSIFLGSVLTDVNGDYLLSGLAPGNYTVVASATDYQTASVGAIVLSNTTTSVDFALQPNPGGIAGTVTDASNGNPVSGATVDIYSGFTLVTSTVTDGSGNYSVSGLAPGTYIVAGSAPNYSSEIRGAIVVSNVTTTVDIPLDPNPGTLSGTVTNSVTTDPIAGAKVSVYEGMVLITTVLTDGSGNYLVSGLLPGTYNVLAEATDFQEEVKTAVITSNSNTVVDFALDPLPGTISGTVTDANTTDPIPNATVFVVKDGMLFGVGVTDANGDYVIPSLPPGTYSVVCGADGYQTEFTTAVVSQNSVTVVNFALDPDPGSIVGTVTNACTGLGVPGIFVEVYQGSTFVGFGVTDGLGNYQVNGLAPGDYTVIASDPNFIEDSQFATVVSGSSTTVDFVLTPIPFPPTDLKGSGFNNTFLTQKERVKAITWEPSPSGCIIEYRVYRDGVLVAVVPATDPLEYRDRNRGSGQAEVYSVTAVNSFGEESSPATITLE